MAKRLSGLSKKLILSERPPYLGIEPSGCCSRTEFLARLEEFDIQVLDAVFYGRVVYDNEFWQKLKKEYEQMEKKIRIGTNSIEEDACSSITLTFFDRRLVKDDKTP